MTARQLRQELSARNLIWAEHLVHETTYSRSPSVIHSCQSDGTHGNFIAASWRRIQARSTWRRRLTKAYTAGRQLPYSHARERGELEAATSSDALLMNIFCYPGMLRRPGLVRLLGSRPEALPAFGVRARIPLLNGRFDRTELDLELGDLVLEAKLTESGFQTATAALISRYSDLDTCFAVKDLPRTANGDFQSYQLVRGVLAAYALERRFAVAVDHRRTDLIERWFEVLRAVRSSDLRSRLQLISWQELAAVAPPNLRLFLGTKYGIVAS